MSELRSRPSARPPAPRRSVAIAACATADGTMQLVQVTNLSLEGARVAASSAFAVGQAVTLHLPDARDVVGTVRWVRDQVAGLRFETNLEPWQLVRIETLARP